MRSLTIPELHGGHSRICFCYDCVSKRECWKGEIAIEVFEQVCDTLLIPAAPAVAHGSSWDYPEAAGNLSAYRNKETGELEYTIFLHTGLDVETAHESCFHELVHLIQIDEFGEDDFFRLYAEYDRKYGYALNPFEVEAREASVQMVGAVEFLR